MGSMISKKSGVCLHFDVQGTPSVPRPAGLRHLHFQPRRHPGYQQVMDFGKARLSLGGKTDQN